MLTIQSQSTHVQVRCRSVAFAGSRHGSVDPRAADRMRALTVVPKGLSPAAALHRRTVWMARRASVLVLFPIDPHTGGWGKNSTLAFNAALYNPKPVFVVASSLCDVVSGFWVLPYPDQKGGVCGDEW